LDVLVTELGAFKDISEDLVILEISAPDGKKRDAYVPLEEFNRAATDMTQILKDARGTRGRVPGTKVNGNGS
jgi:hypothetical protein